MSSLWDSIAAMYPKYVNTNAMHKSRIRALRNAGYPPGEITKKLNDETKARMARLSKNSILLSQNDSGVTNETDREQPPNKIAKQGG